MLSQTLTKATTVVNPLAQAKQALHISVSVWLIIALIGQWFFATYVFVMYAFPIMSANPEQVNVAAGITGYVVGDTFGNSMLFSHVIPAALLSVWGILQLLPYIRSKYPVVHRWNGRLFLTLGLLGAISGLYLTWGRGSRLSDIGAVGISLNGILILVAVVMAWRYARAKQFASHQRWAIHAFLFINGVWFFRLNLMAWYVINQGSNGNTETLDGPMDIFLSFACYGIPMLIAEAVFWAKRQQQATKVWAVMALTSLGGLITMIGVGAAIMLMWLPRIATVF